MAFTLAQLLSKIDKLYYLPTYIPLFVALERRRYLYPLHIFITTTPAKRLAAQNALTKVHTF